MAYYNEINHFIKDFLIQLLTEMGPKKKIQNKYQKMSCDEIFKQLAGQNDQMNQQSFSNLITQVFRLDEQTLLQFYLLTVCMKVQKAGHIKKQHLQNLFAFSKAKTIKDIILKLPQFQKDLNQPKIFKQMYQGVYSIFLIKDLTLDFEYAQFLWAVLLKGKMNYMKQLQRYFQSLGQKKPKKVHKDLWNMMLQFAVNVKQIQKDYNQKDAWPLFFDNFVQFLKQN